MSAEREQQMTHLCFKKRNGGSSQQTLAASESPSKMTNSGLLTFTFISIFTVAVVLTLLSSFILLWVKLKGLNRGAHHLIRSSEASQ